MALGPVDSLEKFFEVIDVVVQQFKHYVEERRGWKMLWNDDGSEKPEEAAQLLFQGLVSSYCTMNNVNIDREVELGRGPVDFKFSRGYDQRALMEVKKLHNGKFWNGVNAQLRSYLRSDQCENGWLLAVQYRRRGVSKERRVILGNQVADSAERYNINIRYELVDARPKESASNLNPEDV